MPQGPEAGGSSTASGALLLAASAPISEVLDILRRDNTTLPDLLVLHQQFEARKLPPGYSCKQGILYFRDRYYVSPHSPLQPRLLLEAHATPMAGHAGVKRTLICLSAVYFWPHQRRSVERFVAACLTCQQTKYCTQPPAGLLQPLPLPQQVWESITMDFITGLPTSRSYSVIMVVVDRLTKYSHFGPLPAKFTTDKAATLFVEMVVKLHGFPTTIVSDRDPIFMSAFWKTLFRLSGTQLHHSTAYHPQSDGQSEVVNRSLEQYLRAFTSEKPSSWMTYLSWAEFCFNSSHHSSIRMTPFQALYGRLPPVIPPYHTGTSKIQALDKLLSERD